jgi:hypothetical protein
MTGRCTIIGRDVCRECGSGYLQRPSLLASLKPLVFSNPAITEIELGKLHDLLCHAWNFGCSPQGRRNQLGAHRRRGRARRLAETGTSIKSES